MINSDGNYWVPFGIPGVLTPDDPPNLSPVPSSTLLGLLGSLPQSLSLWSFGLETPGQSRHSSLLHALQPAGLPPLGDAPQLCSLPFTPASPALLQALVLTQLLDTGLPDSASSSNPEIPKCGRQPDQKAAPA